MGEPKTLWKNIETAFRGTSLEPSRKVVEKLKVAHLNLKNVGVMSKRFAEVNLSTQPPDRSKAGAYSAVSCLCFLETGDWSLLWELFHWVKKEKLWSEDLIEIFKSEIELKRVQAGIVLEPRGAPRTINLPFAPSIIFSSKNRVAKLDDDSGTLLSAVSDEQLQKLLERSKSRRFKKDEIIFHQGDMPDSFYIIVNGGIRLRSTGGFEKHLSTGEIFGEMAVLGHIQRTATAECRSESLVLEFTKDNLYKLFDEYKDLEKQIQKTFEFRLFSLRARNIPSLQSLEEKQLRELFQLFQSTNLSVGEVLVHEGDQSDGIFCILSGLLQVSRKQGPIATLGPGDFVGEVGAYKKIPRNADVIGATDALLLWCHGENFSTLKSKFPALSVYLEELSYKRVAQ